MLTFMRKHQKYFFAVITVVIVLSFSFFGTYSTLAGNSVHEQVAFTTSSGSDVTRQELEEMALFIGTDQEDKKLFGGMWGPNFLNDGVVRKDFLENGMGLILAENYKDVLSSDLTARFNKEKGYKPYTHPQAPFLSSQTAWNYFAPAIAANLALLQKGSDPLAKETLEAKVNLYLAEKRFSAPYLSQVLRYQEKQYGWVQHDQNLDRSDLSLFGYHTLEDWFGPKFNRLVAEFIFNASDIAERLGYRVSKEEALADLMENATLSFQDNKESPYLGVNNPTEYFEQQLYRMRLDRTKAVKVWQKVLLFRKLFHDVGQSMFVDRNGYQIFNQFANQVATGDLYRLPEGLKFSDFKSLQQFETYLDAVTKRTKEEKNQLLLPKTLLTTEEVIKKTPELARKKYFLAYSTVSKKNLQAKVGIKETLNWELDEKNWEGLKKEFPELAVQKAATKEERLQLIDKLDKVTRGRLDQFARKHIVDSHPEWIAEALNQSPVQEGEVSLSIKGPNPPFQGLDQGQKLIDLLDKAPLKSEDATLAQITFDKENYYKIEVKERSPQVEVLTFQEAVATNLLEDLLNRNLEIFYVQLKNQNPEKYKGRDLADVQEEVALAYFEPLLSNIKKEVSKQGEKYKSLEGQRLAAYRFLAQGEAYKKETEAGKQVLFRTPEEKETYANQFQWVKSNLRLPRKSDYSLPESQDLFALNEGAWSKVIPATNGDLYFAKIGKEEISGTAIDKQLDEQVQKAVFLLGNDAERTYLRKILPEIKDKNGISFNYLHAGENSMESEPLEEEI